MSDCNWYETDPYNSDGWETDCGQSFTVNEGKPSENRMVFCCFCGNPLVEHEWVEEDVQE